MSSTMPRLLDRFAPPGEWDGSGLHALRSLLIVHALLRTWFWTLPFDNWSLGQGQAAIVLGMRLVLVAAAIASLWPPVTRLAVCTAAGVVALQIVLSFLIVDDHIYLELFCLVLLAVFDPRDDREGPLLRGTLCWMAVIVLFHSGMQKVLHGYYFFGEFPLIAVAQKDPFGQLFAWMLPASEVARLRDLKLSLPDAGPFRTSSALVLVASNAVWTLEIVLAVLIVPARTRVLGAAIAIVAGLIMGVVAQQPMYALLMAQLFLLCIPGQWNRRLAPALGLAYVAVFVAAAIAPDLVVRGGHL
jgi:hypothetical protein